MTRWLKQVPRRFVFFLLGSILVGVLGHDGARGQAGFPSGSQTFPPPISSLPVLACASTPGPGNTAGVYRQQCQDGSTPPQLFLCGNSTGCAASSQWSAVGGSGITYQGSVTAGAPVVAVSSSKIQSLTASTACTTGFSGLNATVCATVALTNQSAAVSSANLQCGGAICPAGLYRIVLYEWNTSGPSIGSGPQDVSIAWTDTSQAQTYDLSGGAYQTSGTTGVGSYIGSVAYISSSGTANITYSASALPAGTADSIYITLERLM